jgi:regulator of sigma E protease
MSTIITILQFVLALGILVTLHELGHFLAARAFGIKVEKFYLFFDAWGFKLFKFKKGDTEYGIGWLPLGGYVKIAGMVDESLDTKQLKTEPEAWEFRSKPAWQRLIVMVGGVFVNLVLGIVIITGLTYSQGDSFIPNEAINAKGGIYAGPDARKLGFKSGDQIVALNGKPVVDLLGEFGNPSFLMADKKTVAIKRLASNDLKTAVYTDTTITLPSNFEEVITKAMKSEMPFFAPRYQFEVKTVVKGGSAYKAGMLEGDRILAIDSQKIGSFFELKETLKAKGGKTADCTMLSKDGKTSKKYITITDEGTIGFQPKFVGFEGLEKTIKYGLGESMVKGVEKSFTLISANAKGLGKVVSGKTNAKNSLAGPIGIAQMYGSTWDWINFWSLTAMLSLALAFMNILPIPALDGGHVMFLMYEIITRRPVNEKVLYVGQIIGMVILFSLIAFIFWVDIARALGF